MGAHQDHVGKKFTPNPTLSRIEQRLLKLFRQLPELEKERLIEEVEASHRQRQYNLGF